MLFRSGHFATHAQGPYALQGAPKGIRLRGKGVVEAVGKSRLELLDGLPHQAGIDKSGQPTLISQVAGRDGSPQNAVCGTGTHWPMLAEPDRCQPMINLDPSITPGYVIDRPSVKKSSDVFTEFFDE